jgi:hypothetical protein
VYTEDLRPRTLVESSEAEICFRVSGVYGRWLGEFTHCFNEEAFRLMSLVKVSSDGGPVGTGGGNGSCSADAMLGAGVAPLEGTAAGIIPAFLNIFISVMGSGVVDVAGGGGSTRCGGGDLIATIAGGG